MEAELADDAVKAAGRATDGSSAAHSADREFSMDKELVRLAGSILAREIQERRAKNNGSNGSKPVEKSTGLNRRISFEDVEDLAAHGDILSRRGRRAVTALRSAASVLRRGVAGIYESGEDQDCLKDEA